MVSSWTEHTSKEGELYYYQEKTDRSVWNIKGFVPTTKDGHSTFVNLESGETRSGTPTTSEVSQGPYDRDISPEGQDTDSESNVVGVKFKVRTKMSINPLFFGGVFLNLLFDLMSLVMPWSQLEFVTDELLLPFNPLPFSTNKAVTILGSETDSKTVCRFSGLPVSMIILSIFSTIAMAIIARFFLSRKKLMILISMLFVMRLVAISSYCCFSSSRMFNTLTDKETEELLLVAMVSMDIGAIFAMLSVLATPGLLFLVWY